MYFVAIRAPTVGAVDDVVVSSALRKVGALVLAAGVLNAQVVAAGVPCWLGWLDIGGLGVLLAARAFLFGLLPTMGVCSLLGRIG